MKNSLLLVIVSLFFQVGYSQVGINTTMPDAQLDVKSSNQVTPANTDGILIPKIDAFPATNPTAAQNSMMVYLTTLSAGKQPGFYYWDSATTSWVGFLGKNTGWTTTGNAGTNAATNFIGTIDDIDFVFKRNSIKAGTIGLNNTSFGNNSLNILSTGINNLAIGSETLTLNSIGIENVALGHNSLKANTTGSYNTAAGVDALVTNSNGGDNTATGNAALYFNTSGGANTAFGRSALQGNTTANYNTALGWRALLRNKVGTLNTGVGANALFTNTSGIYNSSVGVNSLITNLTGNNNVAMGVESLYLNSTGNDNTAIGTASLKANTVSGNVAVGKDAMLSNTIGLYNTATGSFALQGNINGSYNTAMGYQALFRNTDATNSGISNNAFGVNALYSNTTGGDNIAIGTSTLFANTIGFRNVAIGNGSLDSNTIGKYSVSVGNYSSTANDIGYNNTAVGDYSLGGNVNGFFNVAVGMNSILANIQSENNTALGYQTMYGMTSGTSNTAVGAWSMSNQIAGDNNIAIGRSSFVPSLIGSNQMSIGNVIYGADMSTTALGKIGIGVTIPTEKLEVAGKTKTTNLQMTTGAALGRVLTSDATGNGIWTASSTIASGTLDQAYDFGGAGLGRTVNADAGAVTISGTDGFLCTGTYLSGAPPPSGYGIRAFWYPKKAAFRAGGAASTEWDDANIGDLSVGLGWSTKASGGNSMAFGVLATASGEDSVAIGSSTSATGENSSALGSNNQASGFGSTALGINSSASGRESIVLGSRNLAGGDCSLAFGKSNTAFSFGETVLGLGATNYTPSTNGATEFTIANDTDRLLVVGNAIDTNGSTFIEIGERRNALVILKNGNTGIGNSAPALAKLQIQGAVGNTVSMFNLSANSKGVALVSDWPGVYFNSYYSGGARSMASTGYASIMNTDQSTGGIFFQTTNVANTSADALIGTIPTRMTIAGNGNVGIGAITPGGQFELSLDQGRKPGTSTWTITSDERLKNIHGTYLKGLNEVLKLQPITYNYVSNGKRIFEEMVLQKEFSGFSAQAVQKVFPEAVDIDDDGFLNFNMHPILVSFVNAFKELDSKNKTLEVQVEQLKIQQEKIKSLETINTEILKRLEKLENK